MPAPFGLDGRTVLVTGASSGLGRAACRMVARQGGRVIATGRDEDRLQATLASLDDAPGEGGDHGSGEGGGHGSGEGGSATGPAHRAVTADLLDAAALAALVDGCEPLDGLVLAAGVAQVAPLRYTTDKAVRRVLSINLEARLALCQSLTAARKLAPGCSIVFVSTLSVAQGVTGHVAYAASLAAVEGASRAIAAELAGRGMRSNVVAPGLVRTPALEGGSVARGQMDAMLARYPLGAGEPEDVAAAIVYLLAPASRWVTGQVLRLDGGYTLDA